MTLDGRTAGGTSGDAERDTRLDRLYHEAGGEMPPARLDAAILAAAHREVGARPRPLSSTLRRWRVPVSIAAVVVLSVSLVTLVQEEGSDRLIEIPPVTPPLTFERRSTPVPAAPPSGPTAPFEARPAPADDAGRQAPEPFPGRRQDQRPQAAAVAPQPQAGAPALPDLRAKAAPVPSAPAREETAVEIRSMAAESQSSAETRRSAAQAPASPIAEKEVAAATVGRVMSSASPAPAAKPALRPAPIATVPDQVRAREADGAAFLQRPPIWRDLEQQPPGKWLDRIEELRQASRTAEMNDLIAEFRKRFPHHPLPAWVR